MTIKAFDWIASHANQTPDKIALEDLFSKRTFTYQEMNERIGLLADHLTGSCGIEKGDRVASLSYNNPEMLELQFACSRLGAIFVPLNFRLTVPELEYIVSDCAAKAMIADREFAETAEKVAGLTGVNTLIITNSDGSDSPYEQALKAATPLYDSVDLTLDDPATIIYTSGTTCRLERLANSGLRGPGLQRVIGISLKPMRPVLQMAGYIPAMLHVRMMTVSTILSIVPRTCISLAVKMSTRRKWRTSSIKLKILSRPP